MRADLKDKFFREAKRSFVHNTKKAPSKKMFQS